MLTFINQAGSVENNYIPENTYYTYSRHARKNKETFMYSVLIGSRETIHAGGELQVLDILDAMARIPSS